MDEQLSDKEKNQATSEILDMFENLRKVKGADYAAIVRVVFGSCNYHMTMDMILSNLPGEEEEKHALKMIQMAHSVTLEDMMKTMMHLLLDKRGIPVGQTREGPFFALSYEINADIKMLDKKQSEYGAFAVGGGSSI